MRKFEYLDHTADVGFRAYGETRLKAFENAALALFSLMLDPDKVKGSKAWDIAVQADDLEALLFDWLNELVYLLDSQGVVGKRAIITSLRKNERYELQATVRGELFDPARHEIDVQPKACTYHMLKVEELPKTGGWVAQAICDV